MNECDEIPALCGHGDCQNLPGTYLCQCHPGFLLSDGSCVDINECTDSEDGESLCGSHGRCVNLVGTYECLCDPGFEMANQTCVDINECRLNNPCLNGQCINQAPGYSCQCDPGYHLVEGVCVDADECAADKHPCGLGECVNTPGAYECLCPQGFIFKDNICQDIDECQEDSQLCGPHGDCRNLQGDYECHCHPGFRLGNDSDSLGEVAHHQRICQDVDECENDDVCGEGSICVNQIGSFECTCASGYHRNTIADNKTALCQDTNECLSQNDCQQECLNLPGSYRCACQKGFTLVDDGVSCQDQDECLVENGGCSDICRNTEGSYLCECPKGYRLSTDSRNCQIMEEQAPKETPCRSHSPPPGGFLKCTARKKKGYFPVGTRCRLKCRRGYQYQPLSGPFKTSCQGNGQWSTLGSCSAKLCHPLPELENGTIEPPRCQAPGQTPGGTQCSFSCQSGYYLDSAVTSTTCSSRTSQWSNPMPKCLAITTTTSTTTTTASSLPQPFIMCPGK